MKERRLKHIFVFCSAILLLLMLYLSKDAGISCDEVLHYQHSVAVYNYFASHGEDISALNTAATHLKYYGQSYDNLVTILTNWFGIDDIYGFRHIMSTLAGWLAIFVTAMFAIWLADYRAGIIVLILFAVSPTFMGHAQNNLKDIPFALGYIAGVYYTLKILFCGRRISIGNALLLTLSMAFCISIRAGGLILICYLFFFFVLYYFVRYIKDRAIDFPEIGRKIIWIIILTVIAFFASIILWPFALQNPVKNVFESYQVMAHFPATFRQIFEGKVEWSDYMPWYYLVKSMAITIPLTVLFGLLVFTVFARRILLSDKGLQYGFLVFTLLFPVVFVIIEDSNLYSSWRQFLFLYPGLVLLAAIGLTQILNLHINKYLKGIIFAFIILLAVHPVRYMVSNHPYFYLYYNQFVGGLKGAYGNYETDYYYVSQTEASEWLIDYLEEKGITDSVKVRATYSVNWQFRKYPWIRTSYFRFEERSQYDWDYAIVTNRYIHPDHLKNNIWPPQNTIHVVYADNVPVCAVLERRSKNDYYGYKALTSGRFKEAITYFKEAILTDDKDELIFYNFAVALYNDGKPEMADSVLKKGLEVNPDCEPILMYLGNIASVRDNADEAIMYYEKLIEINRKYFEAYVELSKLLVEKDIRKARTVLRTCLTINPHYIPAIKALADTYRKSSPEIAKKYDELAGTIK
jgi:hypothetical protein